MPGSGPVYQPTTVSYETRPGTGAGGGLLAQTTAASSLKMLRKPAAQMAVLVFGLISLAAGKIRSKTIKVNRLKGALFDSLRACATLLLICVELPNVNQH